jgi:hypothetical protein
VNHTFKITNRNPIIAAQILNEKALSDLRASFKKDGRVFVRAHSRVGPKQWFKTDAERESLRTRLAEAREKGLTL